MRAISFESASEYIAFSRPDLPACLVLDVELPDINGLDFQQQIIEKHHHPPIVFITGHGDIPSSVRAIKRSRRLSDQAVHGIRFAESDSNSDRSGSQFRLARTELSELQRRLSRLTPRERDVLPLVVSGLLNKQAAAELGISEITLQIHRGKIMHKMQAASLADLVRFAEKLQIPITYSRRTGTS